METLVQGVATVAKDQVQKWQDFYQHPVSMVLPMYLGVICIVVSMIVIVTSIKCHKVDRPSQFKDEERDRKIEDEERDRPASHQKTSISVCKPPNLVVALPFLVIGILLVLIINVTLTIRHPRAAAETMLLQSL